MFKQIGSRFLFILLLHILHVHSAFADDISGNPANEIVDLINQNRTSMKLPKLSNSKGLGCMALQYISKTSLNCSSNNTVSEHMQEADITQVYAPDCGVELATVTVISGNITACSWEYKSAKETFTELLVKDRKRLLLLHSEEHTEVGVGVRKDGDGATFWSVLFSSGEVGTSFVLEDRGRGIKQKSGCFSGETQSVCSDGRKAHSFDGLCLCFGFVFFATGYVFGIWK